MKNKQLILIITTITTLLWGASVTANLISNFSVETVGSELPVSPISWDTWSNGDFIAEFGYPEQGYHGERCLSTQISGGTWGDAGWISDPVDVIGGGRYLIGDYYKADVASFLVVQVIGEVYENEKLLVLELEPTDVWTSASGVIELPPWALRLQVAHTISSPGILLTDHYEVFEESLLVGMIYNASLERASSTDSDLPLGWEFINKGDFDSLATYLSGGYDGQHSLRVEIFDGNWGEASWASSAIMIEPGKTYKISDYYRSDTTSYLIVNAMGDSYEGTYVLVSDLPPASSWTRAEGIMDLPTWTTKVRIQHLLSSEGWLETDAYEMAEDETVIPVPTDLFTNPSLEEEADDDPNLPEGWTQSYWGDFMTYFEYLRYDGYDGSSSVKVSVSAGSSGDAKWISEPFSVQPGAYRFSDYYRSNVSTKLMVAVMAEGHNKQWKFVRDIAPASGWTLAEGTIEIESWVETVQISHMLPSVGWLQTDLYSFSEITEPGPETPDTGFVSMVLAGGDISAYELAMPLMDSLEIKGTFFVYTDELDNSGGQYLSANQVMAIDENKHEIGSNGRYEQDFNLLDETELNQHVSGSKQRLELLDIRPVGFLPPHGNYSDAVAGQVSNSYQYLLTTEDGVNTQPYSRYRLSSRKVTAQTTQTQILFWITEAKNNNSWLILTFNQLGSGGNQVRVTDFEQTLQTLIAQNVMIKPVGEFLNVWSPGNEVVIPDTTPEFELPGDYSEVTPGESDEDEDEEVDKFACHGCSQGSGGPDWSLAGWFLVLGVLWYRRRKLF